MAQEHDIPSLESLGAAASSAAQRQHRIELLQQRVVGAEAELAYLRQLVGARLQTYLGPPA